MKNLCVGQTSGQGWDFCLLPKRRIWERVGRVRGGGKCCFYLSFVLIFFITTVIVCHTKKVHSRHKPRYVMFVEVGRKILPQQWIQK